MIEVLSPGGLTTIQDLGRPGFAHLGVPPSGAADPRSLRLANRLVGNEEGAPALETTIRGPRVAFHADAVVALAGAPVSARVDGRAVSMHEAVSVRQGDVLDVGFATAGVRTYLAVHGGIAADRVLGSAATDVLSELGPPILATGTHLALAGATCGVASPGGSDVLRPSPFRASAVLRVIPGPRADRFSPDALDAMCDATWLVCSASNRVGVRLRGPALIPVDRSELASEGLVTGALQVPPSGEPILMLVDHPTTGGYPVLAVVVDEDLPLIGQLRPGERFALRAG